MKKVYLVYGTAVFVAFVYATATGWTVWDSVKSGNWGPQSQSAQSVQHK